MKVLQICHKPPVPPVDGGCIAMNSVSLGLLQNEIELKILTVNTFKHPLHISSLPENYVSETAIETVFIDTRLKIADAFFNLFSGRSYNVERFYSTEFNELIRKTLAKSHYDIVQLESLFVTPYIETIRKSTKARIIYRAHNIEHIIWEKMASKERFKLKRSYLQFLAHRLKKFEISQLNKVDGIAAISEGDMKTFGELGCKNKVEYIPFGLDYSYYQEASGTPATENYNDIFFLGAMDWLPNQEGLDWFLTHAWEKIKGKNPGVKLIVAGRGMPVKFSEQKIEGVTFKGEVSSAIQFMVENGIMVVPLFSGSGVRIKIVEAMALGKVVIATTMAAAGLGAEHMKNIIIADQPEAMAEYVHHLQSNPEIGKQIGRSAKEFVRTRFDNTIIAKRLISFYRAILN